MGNLSSVAEQWNAFRQSLNSAVNTTGSVYSKIKKVIGILVMCIYRLRSVFLAIPVVFAALRLAGYNSKHLPPQVGLNLQATGEFAVYISRSLAVMGPLMLTGGCIVMMFCSRKALYPWAVSIFTLILPLLLLISNVYPV